MVKIRDLITKKEVELTSEAVMIGRQGDLKTLWVDPSVSRKHLEAFEYGDSAFIRDSKSKFGTKVNGYTIDTLLPVEVKPGDVLELGRKGYKLEVIA